MPQLKHEIRPPWKAHLDNVRQEIERQNQEILTLRGMIAVKQDEQAVLRKHASFLVGQLIEEAQLPPAAVGAYELSADGKYLVAEVAELPKE